MKTSSRCGWVLLLALLVAVSAPGALADGGPLTIAETRAETFPTISVQLTALDANGGPIGGLTGKDFVVEENGRPVDTLSVYPQRQGKMPLSVVLAVDVSGSMNDQGKLAAAKTAARDFISGLRPIDRVELIAFNVKASTVVPFTSNRADLDKGLDKLAARDDTALYDATDLAVAEVTRLGGNQVVVVLTDGEDTASKVSLSQVLGIAAQKRVPIYTIGLGGEVRDDVLSRMAKETSGRYYKAPKADDLVYAFKLLSQQIANQYELYWTSPLTPESEAKVDVTIRLAQAQLGTPPARFSYLMPRISAGKQVQPAAPIDPGQLRPVIEKPRPAPPPAPSSLPPYLPELAALSAGIGALALVAGAGLRFTQDVTRTRLATFVEGVARAAGRSRTGQGSGRVFILLSRWIAGRIEGFLPNRQIQDMRRNLVLAGNPYGWGVEEFLGFRALLGMALGVVGYLLLLPRGPLNALLFAVMFGGIGFLLPVFWLGSRIKARQKEIFKAMPNALDLLSVSVEAGLGFDQALGEVVQKWHNALTQEFAILLGELQMGRSRREALRGLMDRTGVQELGAFASALIQADELGASIARTLTIQAEQIRMRRRQRAEREAREAAIKMLIPLVFLMLPSLFVVILGPAVPQVLAAFAQVKK